MSKARANRHSLTMPVQETARMALKETETYESQQRPDAQRNYSTSRERESTLGAYSQTRVVADLNHQHRPLTPTSPTSPGIPSHPYSSNSPISTPPRNDSRDPSKSIFANLKAAKSGTKIAEQSVRKVPQEGPSSSDERKPSRTKSTPDLRAETVDEPVPELPPIDSGNQYSQNFPESHRIPRRPVQSPPAITVPRSTAYPYGPGSPALDNHDRKNGRRFFGMKRGTSSRGEEVGSYSKPSTPILAKSPEGGYGKPQSRDHSTGRNPSPLVETDDMLVPPPGVLKDQRSQSFRDGPGSVLFQGLSKGAGKAAAGFSKTRKWLGNATNHNHKYASSGLAKQEPIPNYQVMNLTLPLREQTRVTRIAKRLEDSKDKTEFWMPALPWRCIDYLNFNGCEVEGLYRVPGSDREIKLWWQRFDQEHDIDLFNQEGLYDVNVIGSLFKMWLRNLPDPILDEGIQDELIAKYEDQKQAPEELKEVLSKLPPWNYYLLFAITCHLSLLNAYEEKNKMSLQNLYICVGPGLKMKQRCFIWLVGDWRSCWTGCITEKEALEEEYRVLSGTDLFLAGHIDERRLSLSTVGSTEEQSNLDGSHGNLSLESQSRQQPPTGRRKENRPARLSPGRSKDDSHLSSSQEGFHGKPMASLAHGRSNSHIPELNLPGKMSPLFAPDGSD